MQKFPSKYSIGRLLRGLGSKRPLDEASVRADVAALLGILFFVIVLAAEKIVVRRAPENVA